MKNLFLISLSFLLFIRCDPSIDSKDNGKIASGLLLLAEIDSLPFANQIVGESDSIDAAQTLSVVVNSFFRGSSFESPLFSKFNAVYCLANYQPIAPLIGSFESNATYSEITSNFKEFYRGNSAHYESQSSGSLKIHYSNVCNYDIWKVASFVNFATFQFSSNLVAGDFLITDLNQDRSYDYEYRFSPNAPSISSYEGTGKTFYKVESNNFSLNGGPPITISIKVYKRIKLSYGVAEGTIGYSPAGVFGNLVYFGSSDGRIDTLITGTVNNSTIYISYSLPSKGYYSIPLAKGIMSRYLNLYP